MPLVDEDGLLSRADNQLGTVFDLVVVSGELPDEHMWLLVAPLDDIDQLTLELVEKTHRGCLQS